MDEVLDVGDIDVLTERIYLGYVDSNGYWADTMFDLNNDANVDLEDHLIWVKDLANAWYGDANLDGEFTFSDFEHVFEGKYDTAICLLVRRRLERQRRVRRRRLCYRL